MSSGSVIINLPCVPLDAQFALELGDCIACGNRTVVFRIGEKSFDLIWES